MNLASAVLGASTVHRLQQTAVAAVLVVGRDRLTRHDLARVGCYNFTAAGNLTRALAPVPVKSLADLYARLPPAALALPQLGAVALAVLGAAFEAKGIGGEAPLQRWAESHATTLGTAVVTFDTIKARERKRTATSKRKRRRAA